MCVEKHAGERITERQHRRCTDLNRMSARMGVGQSRAMRFEHHPTHPRFPGNQAVRARRGTGARGLGLFMTALPIPPLGSCF